MKNLLIIFLGFIPTLALAQNRDGKVTYNKKTIMRLNKEIAAKQTKAVEGITERNLTVELIFSASESLYRAKPLDDTESIRSTSDIREGTLTDAEMRDAEMAMARRARVQNHEVIYKNLDKESIVIQKAFRGKRFLMTKAPDMGKWKVINEEKEIAGYRCSKAVTSNEDQSIEAWYAPEIPVSCGPSIYGDLPGLILELSIDNKRIISAEKIELSSKYNNEIEAPTKGKKVTHKQYEDIVAAKKEELKRLRTNDEREEGEGEIQIRSEKN